MAASYSSFLTTRFYSPVFNTALFDGPFRIYFSQAYESVALKIYHLLQTDHIDLWTSYKKWADQNKMHAFILIYPTIKEAKMAFDVEQASPFFKIWEEGVAIGLENPTEDQDFDQIFAKILMQLTDFKSKKSFNEISF